VNTRHHEFRFLRREFRKTFCNGGDPVTTADPLLNGAVVRQQIPAGGFTNASLTATW